MAESACSIDGCESSVFGRGWCSRHYGVWQRHGDPEAPTRTYVKGGSVCRVDGCDDRARAQKYCRLHYKRWAKYGTPTPRFRATVVDGKRICARCKRDQAVDRFGKGAWCLECNTEHVKKYYVPAETTPAVCDVCGATFAATKRQRFTCSTECKQVRIHRENWRNVQKRRARLKDALVEVFSSREIFERDGWVCLICDHPVDRSKKAPHPESPSVDHIIPLARGGEHSRANAQTAHLLCNVRKGVSLTEEVC